MIDPSLLFRVAAAVTLVLLPLHAWRVRGRVYATFALVILAISLPGALVVHPRVAALLSPWLGEWADVVFLYGMAAAGVHLASLVRPKLRNPVMRRLVSIPGMTFIAAGALCGPWLLVVTPVQLVASRLGLDRVGDVLGWLDLAPLAIAIGSVVTSSRIVPEVVRVSLSDVGPDALERVPHERYRRRAPEAEGRPLRIVQIADPHVGPWQPVAKLRRHLERLVAHDPDLVLLTGDFLTMEGAGTPGALARALEPLRDLPGRCFAVFGNHDHESPDEVRAALAANGIRLLVDEQVTVQTPLGAVQILGADYVGRGRREHLERLFARLPRAPGCLRLLLLHDPSAFRWVPKGEADLTLSGHTHGGQLGLLSFGLEWTVLRRTAWPDHGFFGHGSNRLYVHRGTGFYGFPLRIGVPGESSVLEVRPAA